MPRNRAARSRTTAAIAGSGWPANRRQASRPAPRRRPRPGQMPRVDRPQVPPGQVGDGGVLVRPARSPPVCGHVLEFDRPLPLRCVLRFDRPLPLRCVLQLDGPLPVRRSLGVAEHPLGGRGRRTLARSSSAARPAAAQWSAASAAVASPPRLQRPPGVRAARAARRPAGRPRSPRPAARAGPGAVRRARSPRVPGSPAPAARPQRPVVEPGHLGQLVLGQRPAGDRQRRKQRPGVSAAAAPGPPAARPTGWQPGAGSARPALPALGHQLLGEERIALPARVELVGDARAGAGCPSAR